MSEDKSKTGQGNLKVLIGVEDLPTAGPPTDLPSQFEAAYTAFNTNLPKSVDAFLDENAIVFSVSSNRPVIGKVAVSRYFDQQFSEDNPQFTPLSPVTFRPSRTPAGITATVDGTARWVDGNGAEIINYVFTFVLNPDPKKGWLIASLWGA